jgi:UDP-GlcNAc:undecaprenyl-phosphate GlcNAc-1-phosphate transferase
MGIIVLMLGVFDDKFESRARYKLIWQISIGILMYLFHYRVHYLTNPLGEHFILGFMSLPITVLWYVIILNAINLIDGIDGLACGITIIVCGVLLAVGIKEHNLLVITLSLFLIAGNIAFLGANFYPARIFLGDTGTLFIGLNLAAISTAGIEQYKGITTMTLMIPITVLAIPLLDVFLAFFRRLNGGNIFQADKEHIHHLMLSIGLSQKEIAIIVYAITFLFGMIALGFSFSTKKILFSVLLGLLALMVILAYILMKTEKKK